MKKIRIGFAIIMMIILTCSTTAFAATNRYQENVGVSSALGADGGAVQFSGKNLMVSAKMSQITNTPTSLTITLQKRVVGLWFDTSDVVTIPISEQVQDVFYGISINSSDIYRFRYKLNGGAGSYVEVSLGASSY